VPVFERDPRQYRCDAATGVRHVAWETRMVSMTKKAARGQPFFVPLHEKYAVV
jgi:hypothetical protein